MFNVNKSLLIFSRPSSRARHAIYTIDVLHAVHLLGRFSGASLEGVSGGGGVHTPSRQVVGRLLHPSRQNVFPLRKDELCTKGKNKNIGGKLIKKLIITAYIFTETLTKSARRS